MFINKKLLRLLFLCLILSIMNFTPVFASDMNKPVITEINSENNGGIRFISPEEMDQLITSYEAGIEPQNLFSDFVVVSVSNEGSYCKIVYMNVGFPLDRVDVSGSIKLYNSNGSIVASHTVNEPKLVYGVSRIDKVYPAGGSYTKGTYSLRISDGDLGKVYSGTF